MKNSMEERIKEVEEKPDGPVDKNFTNKKTILTWIAGKQFWNVHTRGVDSFLKILTPNINCSGSDFTPKMVNFKLLITKLYIS